MKKTIILLLIFVTGKLFAYEQKTIKQAEIYSKVAVAIDTAKKMSNQDWKNIENELKKALPKSLVKTMMK